MPFARAQSNRPRSAFRRPVQVHAPSGALRSGAVARERHAGTRRPLEVGPGAIVRHMRRHGGDGPPRLHPGEGRGGAVGPIRPRSIRPGPIVGEGKVGARPRGPLEVGIGVIVRHMRWNGMMAAVAGACRGRRFPGGRGAIVDKRQRRAEQKTAKYFFQGASRRRLLPAQNSVQIKNSLLSGTNEPGQVNSLVARLCSQFKPCAKRRQLLCAGAPFPWDAGS